MCYRIFNHIFDHIGQIIEFAAIEINVIYLQILSIILRNDLY
jgi:hypothetical protein